VFTGLAAFVTDQGAVAPLDCSGDCIACGASVALTRSITSVPTGAVKQMRNCPPPHGLTMAGQPQMQAQLRETEPGPHLRSAR
jgi:hypothetical protein